LYKGDMMKKWNWKVEFWLWMIPVVATIGVGITFWIVGLLGFSVNDTNLPWFIPLIGFGLPGLLMLLIMLKYSEMYQKYYENL